MDDGRKARADVIEVVIEAVKGALIWEVFLRHVSKINFFVLDPCWGPGYPF